MVTGKETTVSKHLNNFTRVCGKCVLESEADVLFGSEIGGHRLGPGAVHIDLRDKQQKPLGEKVQMYQKSNYFGAWSFCGGAAQPTTVRQTDNPRCARHEEQTAKWTAWRVVLLSLPATAKWQWLLLVPHRSRDGPPPRQAPQGDYTKHTVATQRRM